MVIRCQLKVTKCIFIRLLNFHFLGKVTIYIGKRDFIDHLDSVDPIDGVVVVENDYLQGRKVFGMVRPIS